MKAIIPKYIWIIPAFLLITMYSRGQINIILEPGFESGSPSPVWAEASTNFGTPLCTEAACGNGGGSGSHTGDWFAWFGGIAAFEESMISQTVTIPPGNNADLFFFLEQPVCDSPQDFLNVVIDGTDTVFHTDGSSPLCGQIGYSLQTVSLTAYADGLPHEIKFFSTIYGLNGNGSNFFVDDISFNAVVNIINGKLFVDFNSNNMQDINEPNLPYKKIMESNTGNVAFSQPDGEYTIGVFDTGNFVVGAEILNYYNNVPASHNAYFSGFQQIDSLNNFAIQPAVTINDLCVSITPIDDFQSGFNSGYMISYENVGTTIQSPTLIFFPDNDLTFVSANPIPNSITTDSLVWNIGPINPFEPGGTIYVTVNVNAGTPIGTIINSSVRIEPVVGDANPVCNYDDSEELTTSSVDPNDILVNEDTVFTSQLSSPPFLEYIIRFQNTGNDTAIMVKIINLPPFELDSSSFALVTSSHPVNIRYISSSRFLEFKFDDIFLPDSNINEPASHGFIRYRIKPKSTLVAGDSINNNAAIYFDFNAPVITNNAVTEIVQPTSINEWTSNIEGLAIYPNPANNRITIKPNQLTTANYQLTIIDLFGRLIFQSLIKDQQAPIAINVSSFSKGVYFIEVGNDRNIARTKFIKE